MTILHLDYETKSPKDLRVVGLDNYVRNPATRVLMAGWALDDDPVKLWQPIRRERIPSDLKEALRDPSVEKWAFNAQFERKTTEDVLERQIGIKFDVALESWRCTQVLAYMQSFTGGLADIGRQMGLPADKQKAKRGKELIGVFSGPNRVTKAQPLVWRDHFTDPDLWDEFCDYCVQDVVTERTMKGKLVKYSISPHEWQLYAIDQIINDRGLPIDRRFVMSAIDMATRRKAELISEMQEMTGLDNPNSVQQIRPWLQERGYPYADMQKDSIKKTIAAEKESVKQGDDKPGEIVEVVPYHYNEMRAGKPVPKIGYNYIRARETTPCEAFLLPSGVVVGDHHLTQEARAVCVMRLASSKTSTAKYDECIVGLADDDRLRHCFQFAGASRTRRWSGRKIQPQNLPRTPKYLEGKPDKCNFDRLDYVNSAIRLGDYETVQFFTGEVMDAVSGCVRSSITASEGKHLVVCDLSSIETVVIFWLTDCKRGLEVIKAGRDPYKDFATALYRVEYEDVTGEQRTNSKPPVLGAGYRLSGGEMQDGKRTGLWGYAENMGIELSHEESHRAVTLYRETYREVPKGWYAIEDAIVRCLRTGRKTKWGHLEFEVKKPYLRVKKPNGDYMYYYKAQVEAREMEGRFGPYTKYEISYMGIDQVTKQWTRIYSHGGKFIENFVQAIARDILSLGLIAAHEFGYFLVGHVHDELISEEDQDDEVRTWQKLAYLMTEYIRKRHDWVAPIPLGAAGYQALVYRKD